ncbi:hypothetical protein GGI23_004562, partial [Coemansia sp. RSA 2559]
LLRTRRQSRRSSARMQSGAWLQRRGSSRVSSSSRSTATTTRSSGSTRSLTTLRLQRMKSQSGSLPNPMVPYRTLPRRRMTLWFWLLQSIGAMLH